MFTSIFWSLCFPFFFWWWQKIICTDYWPVYKFSVFLRGYSWKREYHFTQCICEGMTTSQEVLALTIITCPRSKSTVKRYNMVQTFNFRFSPWLLTMKQEIQNKLKVGPSDDTPRKGPESLPVGHHDIITDVATFQTTQGFIVTASRDGIVKVWKWKPRGLYNL